MRCVVTKVLSIGNSFSQDAHAYLHALAAKGGVALDTVNLMIGGCPLKDHWENAAKDLPNYHYELNGRGQYVGDKKDVPRRVSIGEALQEGGWDAVTVQQASHDSGLYDTYQPYLDDLAAYIRARAPGARLLIQQTWAYDTDSTHPAFERYRRDQREMYAQLKTAYAKAAEAINAETIPSGDVIQALRALPPFDREKGGQSLCRDGFHMSLTLGRFALAATWYAVLCRKDARMNRYAPPKLGLGGRRLLPVIRGTVMGVLGR